MIGLSEITYNNKNTKPAMTSVTMKQFKTVLSDGGARNGTPVWC